MYGLFIPDSYLILPTKLNVPESCFYDVLIIFSPSIVFIVDPHGRLIEQRLLILAELLIKLHRKRFGIDGCNIIFRTIN
jgi:hypothetical protein